MITLNSIIDELLSLEVKEVKARPGFLNRVHNILKRKDIEKQLQDEQEFEKAKVLRSGREAKELLESVYYKNLLEPIIHNGIKTSLQKIIREGQDLTESQLKVEIANIKQSLTLLGMLKLKVAQAESLKPKE